MVRQLKYEVGTSIGNRDAAYRWSRNLTEDQQEIAKAWTAAYRAGGELAKVRGRLAIGAAGFSRKWQNALRVNVYPPKQDSLRPAIYMYHKIPYAGVFNDGDTIRGGQGAGFMWLPVVGLPPSVNVNNFEARTGQKLIPFRNPKSGNLVLGVSIKVKKVGPTKLSLTRLRRGESGKVGVTETVPVFVGIRQVHIGQKFDLDAVMSSVESELPGLFIRNMGTL